MVVTEIKGVVPGSGKTYTLTKLFLKSNLTNKIILTPTNKGRWICINYLVSFGMDISKAKQVVNTLRKFKHNFYERKAKTMYFDMESTEWKEHVDVEYTTTHSKKHFKKVWNIFIDEASMISKAEMDDLINNWKIHNLVLDGDSNQFDPIGSSFEMKLYEHTESVWLDSGDPYDIKADNQVILNKSMRARDPILQEAIDLIKNGEVIDGLIKIVCAHKAKDCENKLSDWHIAYTNVKCAALNSLYKNPRRFMVTHNDNIHGFYTSEILDIDDRRLRSLNQCLLYESLNNSKVPSFDQWRENYLKPAYAVTCHKLQGSTISEGDIYIHLDDILYGLQKLDGIADRAKLFQKFIYIAVSRAVSVDQINIYGLKDIDLGTCMYRKVAPMAKVNGKWIETNKSVNDELIHLQSTMKPLVDESILEDAVEFASDDENLLDYLLNCLSYDESDVETLEGEDEYREVVGKAHSVQHKQHKQHKHKYTDEYLLTFKTKKDLIQVTKNQKIINRWKELHNEEPKEENMARGIKLVRASEIDGPYDEETKEYALDHKMYWKDIFYYFNTPECTYKLGELIKDYVENDLIPLPKNEIDQICAFVARRIEMYDPDVCCRSFYQAYLQVPVSQELAYLLICDLEYGTASLNT